MRNKYQNGGTFVVVMGIVILLVSAIIAGIASYISAANYGNRTEVALKAKIEDNENIYANGTQKVIEIAQVPKMYTNAVSKVTREAIEGRYGENGSQAVFQLLVEQNPTIDPSLFKDISQTIKAFRDEFKNSQTQMLEQRRSYETALGSVWQGFWLRLAGYPRIDLSKFTIVTTDRARDAFDTKRDKGLQLDMN